MNDFYNDFKNGKITLGAVQDPKDNRDYRLSGITEPVTLPLEFELPESFDAKDQDGRGSCTAQAQAHHKERQEQVPLSARFIFQLEKMLDGNSGYGSSTRQGFAVVNKYGACEENLSPESERSVNYLDYLDYKKITPDQYNNASKHKSQSFWRVDNSIELIKQSIFKNKVSVVFSMPWYAEFFQWQPDGTIKFNGDLTTFVGGHCMDICGWGTKGFKVKQSWGKKWGLNGYFWLPYSLFNMVWDAWTSLDIPQDLPVDIMYGATRTWATYLQERAFGFNTWLKNKIHRLPTNREIKAAVYGYWDYEAIFTGRVGDKWLYMTKPAYIKSLK